MERLSALEKTNNQKKEGALPEEKDCKDSEDVVQGQMERTSGQSKMQKPEKAVSDHRKNRVVLVGDSLVRHVGRNMQKQCAGFDTVCKPGARIEQMFLEIENKDEKEPKEDTMIVQVGTNNLRMDETEEIMSKFKDMMQS